jgi:hypothetical protein
MKITSVSRSPLAAFQLSHKVVPAALGLGAWLVPQIAWACPMCFSGNGVNQSAFLYGSLFLMFLPVTAIGSLIYWGYRRYHAWENVPHRPPEPQAPEASQAPHVAAPRPLQAVSRR